MPNGETAQAESSAYADDDKIFTIQTRRKLVHARGAKISARIYRVSTITTWRSV